MRYEPERNAREQVASKRRTSQHEVPVHLVETMAMHGGKRRTNQSAKSSSKPNRKTLATPRTRLLSAFGASDAPQLYYIAFALAIAGGVSVLHGLYLSNLFENDRFFSHLSTLEREMSFRTEMGLYYSYYKTMVKSSSFLQGLNRVVYDNRTEYPDTINTLKRFNLYPEVSLAFLFRFYDNFMAWRGVSAKECFTINRGYGQSPVESCSGLGDETYFYVYSIFGLNGLLAGLFFLMSVYLSGSFFGGILAVASFFFNHSEATRVMWTPPLRESFAYPFLFLQMFCVTWTLRTETPRLKHALLIAFTSVLFMLPWQFSQFALLTQAVSLFGVYTLGYLSPTRLWLITFGHVIALLVNYVLQFGNAMLLTSYFGPCLVSVMIILRCESIWKQIKIKVVVAILKVALLCCGTLALKFLLGIVFQLSDDAHIGDILKAKFGLYKDFHTQLYTCAREFDFMEWEYIQKTSTTLLLPAGLVTIVIVLGNVVYAELERVVVSKKNEEHLKDAPKRNEDEGGEGDGTRPLAAVLYHFFQLMAFGLMAFLIMRLKLFFTPHLCAFVALLASKEVCGFLQKNHRRALLVVLLAAMTVQGQANIRDQLDIVGEFNNADHETLIEWIQKDTSPNAVFAGSMPVCASVKLSAERPIVNHPHYEDAGLRNRTHHVYQMYSRKPAEEIYRTLADMGVNYVIVEKTWCYQRAKEGCSMSDLWDAEDKENENGEQFCDVALNQGVPRPFVKVFRNDAYLVLRVQKMKEK